MGLVDITLEGLKEREKERDEEIKNMKEEVDTLKSLVERVRVIRLRHSLTLNVDDNPCSIRNIPSQMFEKHKDAQSESLKDIEQEVKSLKSLLSRRPGAAPESTISRSASPSQSNLSAVAQSYQPSSSTISSSYTPSNSRFGLSGAGASQSGMSPSSSFANIMNRPPGIPAWQMQASASSSSISSSTPPAAANSTPRPSQANEQVSAGSSASENKTDNQDGGYVADESTQKNDKATTLEESGEVVPSGSETTSREVV